jgi:hypothetical protein
MIILLLPEYALKRGDFIISEGKSCWLTICYFLEKKEEY